MKTITISRAIRTIESLEITLSDKEAVAFDAMNTQEKTHFLESFQTSGVSPRVESAETLWVTPSGEQYTTLSVDARVHAIVDRTDTFLVGTTAYNQAVDRGLEDWLLISELQEDGECVLVESLTEIDDITCEHSIDIEEAA